MKKLILCGLVGALAMLLANIPIDAQAMDSGMMSGGGYSGYDMGSGMMRYGGYQAHGMGSSMMGPSGENGLQRNQNRAYIDQNGAERIFEDYLKSEHNPNLKLGKIKDEGSFFEADLVTRDNSLVDKLIVDKDTGHLRSIY
ncbi:MAG: hypothetical protein PVF78_02525 [Desulfobacterales bacterium]|jgi:hypothetical protein